MHSFLSQETNAHNGSQLGDYVIHCVSVVKSQLGDYAHSVSSVRRLMHTPQVVSVGRPFRIPYFDSRMSIPRLARGVKVRGFHLGASHYSLLAVEFLRLALDV